MHVGVWWVDVGAHACMQGVQRGVGWVLHVHVRYAGGHLGIFVSQCGHACL